MRAGADPLAVRALRERIDELEAENEQLRALAEVDDVDLPGEWKLSPLERETFCALLERKLASREYLMARLYGLRPDPPEEHVIDVRICHLRRKLRPFGVAIVTAWGRGWSLEEAIRQRYGRSVP